MHVHIIGGGIIGLSSAWYLQEAGIKVTLIDRNELEDGTSHGNAGMLVPSHFVPLAAPGVITQGLRWLLDSKSPFYIKPRLNLDLAQWLWQFYRSCTPQHVARAMPILHAYNEWSKTLYENFAQLPDFDFAFEKKGLLMLFQEEALGKEEAELAEKAHDLGMEAQLLDADAVKALEKGTRVEALGGVYYPGDAHLYPNRFLQQLVKALKNAGVEFITGRSLTDFRAESGQVKSILLDDQTELPVEHLVLAAGSWSAQLLKKLKYRLLLQDGKGYSFTLQEPGERPHIPTILTEAKVAVTPMGKDLRIGGTLEISNLSDRVNTSRLAGIVESMPRYYPDIKVETPALKTVWHGFRPCTPDGLPYMGYPKAYSNLMLATGHAMMGMSMGPASGKLVAQMIMGQATDISVDLFKPDRF